MVGLAQLLEERDLPQDRHGDAVLGQGQLHLLDGHDLVAESVPGLVHGPIRSCTATGQYETFKFFFYFLTTT